MINIPRDLMLKHKNRWAELETLRTSQKEMLEIHCNRNEKILLLAHQ